MIMNIYVMYVIVVMYTNMFYVHVYVKYTLFVVMYTNMFMYMVYDKYMFIVVVEMRSCCVDVG